MPFTPLHLDPALAPKSLAKHKFSLLIFAWAQILMDLQPLAVILTGKGQAHGVTHTFLLAIPIGLAASLSGRLAVLGLARLFGKKTGTTPWLTWRIAILSGLTGSLSHVLLDALIYTDMHPFWPFISTNPLVTGQLTDGGMASLLVYTGIAGLIVMGVSGLVDWIGQP